MKVRIGIAETSKVVELEAKDAAKFQKEIEDAVSSGGIAWFDDTRGRKVGIPADAIAFVEIDPEDVGPAVGFAPS